MATNEQPVLVHLEVDGETVEVESIAGEVALSRPFQFCAHLVRKNKSKLKLGKLVGKDFELTISTPLADKLTAHGIVADATPHEDPEQAGYLVTLVPRLHLRTLKRNHRVFQNATVKSLVTALLTQEGPDIGTVKWSVTEGPVRTYVVQSGETDWEFIERLLADEGMFYFFDFQDAETVLNISDDSRFVRPISGGSTIPVRDASNTQGEDGIYFCNRRWSIATDRVRLKDRDWRNPDFPLDETVSLGKSSREYYDAPGRFLDSSGGQRRATLIGEALRAEQNLMTAHTSVIRLLPGFKFTLSEHPISSNNVAHLVTGLALFAREGRLQAIRSKGRIGRDIGLTLQLTAIPLDVPYRSAVPRPFLAAGPQTAVIAGPSSDEIHTDQEGLVKPQFYWDRIGKRDQNSSTPTRVAQFPLAGSMMLPRIGWDQFVGFVAGDVDHPVVMGHLYDSVAKVPYELPQHKTRTAWQTATTPANGSANEIRYEDKAGSEEIFLNASYDMTYEVGHDSSVTVGVDQSTEIGVNQTVKVGSNQSVKVTGAQEVSVGVAETLTVSGSRSCMIGGSDTESVGVARTVTASSGMALDADGGRTLTAGALMMSAAGMSVERMTLGKASVTVGGAWIAAAGTGVESVTAGSSRELIGGAKIQAGGAGISTSVKGKLSQTVGGALITAAGSNVGETSGAALTVQVGGAMVVAGPKVVFEAKSKLVIKVGGTSLTMTPSKIHIKSPSLASPGATIAKTGSTVNHNP